MTQDMNETKCQGWTDGQRNGQYENKTVWQTLQILIRLCSDDGVQCFDLAKKTESSKHMVNTVQE